MKPYLTIAALLAVTIPANAANSFIYDCGAAEIAMTVAKKEGVVVGRNIWFKIKLRGKDDEEIDRNIDKNIPNKVTGGTIIFREIDNPIAYQLFGKSYKCKLTDSGPFSQYDD